VRYGLVETEKAQFPVSALCAVLRVSRSGYYAWKRRPRSARAVANEDLALRIRATFRTSRCNYGSPRLYRELRAQGVAAGRHRIARLMREHGLAARLRRRFCVTTQSGHSLPVAPNLVRRNFQASGPNRLWASDVTFIATVEGWHYLAVVLDLYSRRVVGWACGAHNDEALVVRALRMALEHRRPPRGLVHHSDRGTTYAAGGYQGLLRQHGITCSMSRKGDCWDNAPVESFFSTLKTEAIGSRVLPASQLTSHLFDYIECFYNPTRRHSSIGFLSPAEFEKVSART
jgi:putative transposase